MSTKMMKNMVVLKSQQPKRLKVLILMMILNLTIAKIIKDHQIVSIPTVNMVD